MLVVCPISERRGITASQQQFGLAASVVVVEASSDHECRQEDGRNGFDYAPAQATYHEGLDLSSCFVSQLTGRLDSGDSHQPCDNSRVGGDGQPPS